MQDGVAENFTAGDARALPGRTDGCATQNRGLSFVDPVALRDHVTAAGRGRLPGALPRARRPRGPRGARRGRGGPRGQRARPTAATTSRTCRSCTPTTCRGSRELGAVANIQPLWACPRAADGRADHPVPRRAPGVVAVPVRGPAPRPGRSWPPAATGRSAAPNPLRGIHVAVNRIAPGGATRAVLPAQPGRPGRRASRRTPPGSAYVNHLDEVTGRIEVGYYADLAVLDRDVFAHPPDEIARRPGRRDLRRGRTRLLRQLTPAPPPAAEAPTQELPGHRCPSTRRAAGFAPLTRSRVAAASS